MAHLEMQLKRELQNARIARRCNPSESGRAQIPTRGVEIGVIDHVEALGARFQPESFQYRKFAAQSNVDAQASRSAQRISPQPAERPGRIRNESRRIDP